MLEWLRFSEINVLLIHSNSPQFYDRMSERLVQFEQFVDQNCNSTRDQKFQREIEWTKSAFAERPEN